MRILYAASTSGFYLEGVHAIPADAMEITGEEHRSLLAAQAQGKQIQPGSDGRPVAVDPPAPTLEELAAAIRAERDRRLTSSDRYALPDYPHADEAARQAWLAYRQALRNMPELEGFPWAGANDPAVPWPVEPVGGQG